MRDRALGSTIRMQFNSTNPDGGGAPVAPSSAFVVADIRIYKDGSATEKATTNGLTVTSPFDSITGLHLVEIDTSNSTGDSGFWASGSAYSVRLVTAKTVATYSVSGLLIGEFSIELQTGDVRKFGGTAITAAAGIPEVKVASVATDAINAAALAANAVTEIQSGLATSTNVTDAQTAIITQIDANETKIDSIQSDTNDIQSRLPAALESGRIAAALDSAAILAVADQVWDEAMSGHTTAGTYGGRIVRATNSNNEVQITGSNHIAADIHELQSGVITAGDFAANSITASALAADAVTEIQSGLATSAALATESGKITNIENASGYLLAVLAGACADPQTASETYAITVFGSTFTVDMAGQTSTGTRTAPTLTKT